MRIVNFKLKIGPFAPLFFFCAVILIYFHKLFFGKVPIPFDILVGGYWPWLDLGKLPVKNPAISDVYSNVYLWRQAAIDMMTRHEWPLWNPYSFAGTPLLGNWQSAAFYPLNIIMVLFGMVWGWSLQVMLGPLLALLFMYVFLRELTLPKLSAIFGSVVFAFAGFNTIFLEYSYPVHSGLWLPLLLLCIKRWLRTGKSWYLLAISGIIAIMIFAGFYQAILYSLAIAVLFAAARTATNRNYRSIARQLTILLGFFGLGFGLAAIQLLPVLELFGWSIRNLDNNIVQYNYGLLPLKSIVTFIAPDFYGNPTTGNFWGFLYHETAGYFGVIAVPFVLVALLKSRDKMVWLFSVLFIVSFILLFDTPIGRAVYVLNMPFLASSYASRLLFIVDFSAAVLAAYGLAVAAENKLLLRRIVICLLIGIAVLLLGLWLFTGSGTQQNLNLVHIRIAQRNLLFPLLLTILLGGVLAISRWQKAATLVLVGLLVLDLFRFGFKYNPFVSAQLAYPVTPVIDFLKQNAGYYRIDKVGEDILPANVWMAYGLYSPSGYDPLYPLSYARFYNLYNNNPPESNVTRYASLERPDSPFIDLVSVKYLLIAKRNNDGKIDKAGTMSAQVQKDPRYTEVFASGSLVVLENKTALPRAAVYGLYDVIPNNLAALQTLYKGYDFHRRLLVDQNISLPANPGATGSAAIVRYNPNTVIIQAQASHDSLLLLTDTNYPGWHASVNGKPTEILTADGVFRAVQIPAGQSTITFWYLPKSFETGKAVSGFTLGLLLSIAGMAWWRKRTTALQNQ